MSWEPPPGMLPSVVRAWRKFYADAQAKYKLSPEDYRLLYVAQKGRCWICRTAKGIHPDDPRGAGSRRLGVDHNHVTGAVRGLLCTGSTDPKTCNRLIEFYTPEALMRAAQYKAYPPARVLEDVKRVERDMEMTQLDRDRLAESFLWGGRA